MEENHLELKKKMDQKEVEIQKLKKEIDEKEQNIDDLKIKEC